MRSGKGDKRFFCIRDLVRGFWGNAIVIGAQVPGWWRLAAVKARQLGLTHTEGSRYLRSVVTTVLQSRVAVSLARSLHRLEVFAWYVYLVQIPPYDGATCGADQCCGRFGDDLRLVLVRVRAVKAKREPLSGVCTSSAQPGASLLLFRDISSLVRGGGGDEIRA